MKDERVAYGAGCLWWDDIRKVGINNGLPCCPKCNGLLFEMENPKQWWDGVDEYEAAGNVGYHDFVAWLQGKCFKSRKEAIESYKEQLGIEVTFWQGKDETEQGE